jgi:hypothetical protein
MVFYMNFADGNRPERYDYEQWLRYGKQGPMPTVHREVRVRDYFFTAGFMYFGMWIGLAACCLMNALFSSKDNATRKTIAPICAALLIVSPILPACTNYKLNNRTGDWVPYDYAYNLLNSCEPNGILFTNGDNDTFPLWALQEAYGVRNDVRVVNLSLVNTDWYIKQLKKLEPQVPISYSEKEIEKLQPQLNPFKESRAHTLKNAKITFMLPGEKEQRVLRVQDMMVLNIVDATKWSKPIYFAMTTSDDNLMGLAPYLQSQGLVYKLMPERVNNDNHYDLDRTIVMVDSVFLMRGIGKAQYIDTSRRLLTNYLQIAFDLRRPMDRLKRELAIMKMEEANNTTETTAAPTTAPDSAAGEQQPSTPKSEKLVQAEQQYNEKLASVLTFLDKCVEIMPWDWRPRGIRHEFYLDNDMADEAIAAMEEALKEDPKNSSQYETMLDQAKKAKGG